MVADVDVAPLTFLNEARDTLVGQGRSERRYSGVGCGKAEGDPVTIGEGRLRTASARQAGCGQYKSNADVIVARRKVRIREETTSVGRRGQLGVRVAKWIHVKRQFHLLTRLPPRPGDRHCLAGRVVVLVGLDQSTARVARLHRKQDHLPTLRGSGLADRIETHARG